MGKITLRRSSVPGKVPTTAELNLGEVAINTHDGCLYFKKKNIFSGKEQIISLCFGSSGSIINAISILDDGVPRGTATYLNFGSNLTATVSNGTASITSTGGSGSTGTSGTSGVNGSSGTSGTSVSVNGVTNYVAKYGSPTSIMTGSIFDNGNSGATNLIVSSSGDIYLTGQTGSWTSLYYNTGSAFIRLNKNGEFRLGTTYGGYYNTIYSNGIEAVRIHLNQNVSIGTQDNLARLAVRCDSGFVGNAFVVQNIGPEDVFTVTNDKNVLVTGSFRVTGSVYIRNLPIGSYSNVVVIDPSTGQLFYTSSVGGIPPSGSTGTSGTSGTSGTRGSSGTSGTAGSSGTSSTNKSKYCNLSSGSNIAIDGTIASGSSGVEYSYVVSDCINVRTGTIKAVWNIYNQVTWAETSTTDIGNTSAVRFNFNMSGSQMYLYGDFPTSGWFFSFIKNTFDSCDCTSYITTTTTLAP